MKKYAKMRILTGKIEKEQLKTEMERENEK